MKWSLRLGSIAGIGIFVHWSFPLIIIWVVAAYLLQGLGGAAAANGVLLVFAIFGCIVLHELGHALTARRYGIGTRDITLLPIGGVARLERMPEEPGQEFRVAVAGPAVNLVIFVALYGVLSVFGAIRPFLEIAWVGGDWADFFLRLMWFNLFIVLFNLLPAFPMDGGRILRSILARRFQFLKATEIASKVGQLMALLFGLFGLFTSNLFLILIAVFVYFGAQGEANSVRMTASVRGRKVKDAMRRQFRSLSEEDELEVAVDLLFAGGQQEFPVWRDGRVIGWLSRKRLLEGLESKGKNARVGAVMQADYPVVKERDALDETISMMAAADLSALPVVDSDGNLVGLLTTENIGEFVMLQAILRRTNRK